MSKAPVLFENSAFTMKDFYRLYGAAHVWAKVYIGGQNLSQRHTL